MYGKLFTSMYDGTLGTKGPWQALVTFQQLIILADRHGTVDMTSEAIARQTTIPLEIIQVGLAALEQPDPESRTPDEEGRRIVRLSDSRTWGWRIVNHGHYRKIRSADERREYMKQYMRKRRAQVADPDAPVKCPSCGVLCRQNEHFCSQAEIEKHNAPAKPKAKPDSWVAEGVEWWNENVGTINYGRFGTALKPLVDKYGWERVFPKVQSWAAGEAQTGKPVRIEWFAANGVLLIETVQPANATRQAPWKQEEYDRDMNKQRAVRERVEGYRKSLNGKGDEWWLKMRIQAARAGRYAMVYAYEHVPKEWRNPA